MKTDKNLNTMIQIKSLATAALLSAFALGVAFTGKLAPTTFKANTEKSNLHWYATKVTGKHDGFVKLASGSLITNGKTVTGGQFEIDMTTISVADLPADNEYNGKLVGHLKSEDFFSVEKHNKALFVISKVTPKGSEFMITGKMTIKGIANDISFPATITNTGKQISAKAKIVLDRTKWDIRYGSGKFFENIGDKAIHDDFTIELNLVTEA